MYVLPHPPERTYFMEDTKKDFIHIYYFVDYALQNAFDSYVNGKQGTLRSAQNTLGTRNIAPKSVGIMFRLELSRSII